MKQVRFDIHELIKSMVIDNKSIDTISRELNLEKSFVINILKNIKSDIISSLDESEFFYVNLIDSVLGIKPKKNITNNFGGINRNKAFELMCDGKSNIDITCELGITLDKYLYLLKSMYYDLCSYGSSDDKLYIPLIKYNIIRTIRLLKKSFKSDEESISITPSSEYMILKDLDGSEILTSSKFQQVYDMKDCSNIKFLVISDTHFGSKYENFDYLKMVYEYASKNSIKYIFHCGDFFEGTYANSRRCKPKYRTVDSQVEHVLKEYCYDDNIENIILLGNHDAFPIISSKVDVRDLLSERDDFNVLGYRSAYIKINDEYISLKHEISRLMNEVEDKTVLLNFFGHSHQYKCYYDGKYAIFRAPTLSDLASNSHTVINKGFLDCSIDFDKGSASNLFVNYIPFDEYDHAIGFERKLKK